MVPGFHKDSLREIPRFAHLNIGANFAFGNLRNRIFLGSSYSKILCSRTYYRGTKSNFDRVIGEFSYMRYLVKSGFGIKLAYTPVFFDNGANDVEFIPFSFAFQIGL